MPYYAAKKPFERNGIWGYDVGLSPHDKEGENLGTAGKWRWKIVDTTIGKQIKNVLTQGLLYVSDSTCNDVGDMHVYVSIGVGGVMPASVFHLERRPTIVFVARWNESASDAEEHVVSIYGGLSGHFLLKFNRFRDSPYSLREDTFWWLKTKEEWRNLALFDVHVDAKPSLATMRATSRSRSRSLQ